MPTKLQAREHVLNLLTVQDLEKWEIRTFSTELLKDLYNSIELADFGRGSKYLNRTRIRVLGELLIRGEIQPT